MAPLELVSIVKKVLVIAVINIYAIVTIQASLCRHSIQKDEGNIQELIG